MSRYKPAKPDQRRERAKDMLCLVWAGELKEQWLNKHKAINAAEMFSWSECYMVIPFT